MTRKSWYISAGLLALLALAYGYRIHKEVQDFAVFYLTGQRALLVEPLYRESDGFEIFKYSPLFAFFVAPFALVPVMVAKQLWLLLNITALVGTFSLLNSLTKTISRPWGPFGLAVLTYLTLYIYLDDQFVYGQVNLVVLFLEVLAFKCLQDDQNKSAAASLAAAVLFKLTPLIFVPYLIVKKRWKVLGWLGAFILVGLGIPALFYGWQGNLSLLADWRSTMQGRHPLTDPSIFLFNDNLQSLLFSIFGPIPVIYNGFSKNLFYFPQIVANVIFCIVIVSIALSFLWFLLRRSRQSSPLYELALLLLLQTVLSPLAWKHTFVHLIPLVYFLFVYYRRSWKWLYRVLIPIGIVVTIPRDLTPGLGPILEFYWLHLWFTLLLFCLSVFVYRKSISPHSSH